MPQLARALALLAALLAPGFARAAAPGVSGAAPPPIRQVYLVQDSGWMEPFYTDARAPFRPLVSTLVAQSRLNETPVTLAAFDQAGEVAGRASPDVRYAGPYDAGAVERATAGLDLPRKRSGAYADTDFAGAFAAARITLLAGGEGVVWIVTNNKNSPGDSADVRRNTQRFYAELAGDAAVTRIAGFLVRMPAQGRDFAERGLVVYAVAVGADAARALDLVLSDGAPLRTGLFRGNPPLRLKPLTQQALTLRIDGSRADGGASAWTDRGVLMVRGVREGREGRLHLTGAVGNALYPYRIERATLTPVWTRFGAGDGGDARAVITPDHVEQLAAGAERPVALDLVLPALRSRDLLQGRGVAEGLLEVRLSDVRLGFDPAFTTRAQGVFGGDVLTAAAGAPGALPDLFYRGRDVRAAVTRLPVRMVVEFSAAPLWLMAGAALLVLAALGSAWSRLGRPVRFRSRFLGREVVLRRGHEVLPDVNGRRVEIRRSLFGAAKERYLDDETR